MDDFHAETAGICTHVLMPMGKSTAVGSGCQERMSSGDHAEITVEVPGWYAILTMPGLPASDVAGMLGKRVKVTVSALPDEL